jgi:3-dehydro-L-gulonate 2-dehydrogenase
MEEITRVPYSSMLSEFTRILSKHGFNDDRAGLCATIFADNSLEGVYSHGVNRFPRFIRNVQSGFVIPAAVPELVHASGALEQWNGNLGPGPLNALSATDRAMELATSYGLGMVGLANTNHWMRAGTYGWRAALKGFAFICWTNTCRNMPAWGGRDPRLGNNPWVMAIPYGSKAIVLDMAMTQYSYGKMELLKAAGKKLPFPGGFNQSGELTYNPAEILDSTRPLPIGFWKGSGFSLMLDLFAAVLSSGRPVSMIEDCTSERGVSQIFLAMNLSNLKNYHNIYPLVDQIIKDLKGSLQAEEGKTVRYPGENIDAIRAENLDLGMPVNKAVWNEVLTL